MAEILEQLIPIISVTGIFILPAIAIPIVWFYHDRRKSQERMAMIERGIDISELYKLEKPRFRRKRSKFDSLRKGMICVGVGVGIYVGFLLNKYTGFKYQISIATSVTFFVGVAFLIYFFLVDKNQTQEHE